jgi:hypothetical protein
MQSFLIYHGGVDNFFLASLLHTQYQLRQDVGRSLFPYHAYRTIHSSFSLSTHRLLERGGGRTCLDLNEQVK